jgi:hypothetical protein
MSLGKSKILSQAASGIVGTDNFQIITYTGTGSTQSTNSLSSQSGTINFQPDLIWFKNRSGAYLHQIYNSITGVDKFLNPGVATTIGTYTGYEAERTNPSGYDLTSFNSNGFTVGLPHFGSVNEVGFSHVAWCWKGGGAASSNTNGSITSQVSANTNAGFSIATYTGNSTQDATIGHGLTSPKLTIVKNRSQADSWFVGSTLLGTNKFMELNNSAAATTNSDLNYQILSTTFKTTSSSPHDMINQSGENYIMYTFADVAGYQKIGSYNGSGSSGKSVTTGFRPRFVMTKNTQDGASFDRWYIQDSVRGGGEILYANSALAESSFTSMQFDDDGFTLNTSDAGINESSKTYLYLAIA